MTSLEADALITRELHAGERVLWTGVPAQRRITRGHLAAAAVLLPFGFLIAVLAVFICEMGWGALPFAAVVSLTLYIGATCIISTRAVARCTAYAVTDRRVLIVRRGRYACVTSLDRHSARPWLVPTGRGLGTISFRGVEGGTLSDSMHAWRRLSEIEDAARVFALITGTMDERSQPGSDKGVEQ